MKFAETEFQKWAEGQMEEGRQTRKTLERG